METKIIDGKNLRDDILVDVKKRVEKLSFQPIFCDVLVGDDPVSLQYVQMKARTAESIGIKFHNVQLLKSINNEELIKEINKINDIENMCGLIVQLPLPEHVEKQTVLNAISPEIDVDCLNKKTSDLFYENKSELCFPTALACIHILDSLNINLSSKKIVILGQGMLVGKPVAHILKERNLNVDIIDRSTEDEIKNKLIKNADIIISATGSGKIIKGHMIKEGVIIIDAGTSESKGGIIGDVDTESVKDIASYVSPVPGGVGPVTVAMLLHNVLKVAEDKNNDK